jgi:3,4-dihydroxy 2-butanone 4-phosphate synthase / GTP cyclohydrolase II
MPMFTPIAAAIEAYRCGDPVIVVDDEGRENEGDLIIGAEAANAERLAFMVRHTSGLICAPITERRRAELELPMMVIDNEDPKETAFTVSVDYRHGTTTGISASDRAMTIAALADARSGSTDFSRPGHVFPLVAREGGVIARPGHTEAAVDLSRMAGLSPAGAIGELVCDSGEMMRGPELSRFAKRYNLPFISIEALQLHRLETENWIDCIGERISQTRFGPFRRLQFRDHLTGAIHVAWCQGGLAGAPLLRVQLECASPPDIVAAPCSCANAALTSLRMIASAGAGCLLVIGRASLHRQFPDSAMPVDAAMQAAVARQVLAILAIKAAVILTGHEEAPLNDGALNVAIAGHVSLSHSSVMAITRLNTRWYSGRETLGNHSLIEAG